MIGRKPPALTQIEFVESKRKRNKVFLSRRVPGEITGLHVRPLEAVNIVECDNAAVR